MLLVVSRGVLPDDASHRSAIQRFDGRRWVHTTTCQLVQYSAYRRLQEEVSSKSALHHLPGSDGDGNDDDSHLVVNEQWEVDEEVDCGHNCDDEAAADCTNTKGDPICGWGIVMAEDCLCSGRWLLLDG